MAEPAKGAMRQGLLSGQQKAVMPDS